MNEPRESLDDHPSHGWWLFSHVGIARVQTLIPRVLRQDAARHFIVDGKKGVLADPRNPLALARSIIGLLQAPEVSAVYGAAGKRRLEEVFTFPRYCERLRTVLESDFA